MSTDKGASIAAKKDKPDLAHHTPITCLPLLLEFLHCLSHTEIRDKSAPKSNGALDTLVIMKEAAKLGLPGNPHDNALSLNAEVKRGNASVAVYARYRGGPPGYVGINQWALPEDDGLEVV